MSLYSNLNSPEQIYSSPMAHSFQVSGFRVRVERRLAKKLRREGINIATIHSVMVGVAAGLSKFNLTASPSAYDITITSQPFDPKVDAGRMGIGPLKDGSFHVFIHLDIPFHQSMYSDDALRRLALLECLAHESGHALGLFHQGTAVNVHQEAMTDALTFKLGGLGAAIRRHYSSQLQFAVLHFMGLQGYCRANNIDAYTADYDSLATRILTEAPTRREHLACPPMFAGGKTDPSDP